MANSFNMTSTVDETRPSGPRLPQELMDLVLRNVDDEAWLWVVGRQVSHKIRKETERIFLEGLLRETEVRISTREDTHLWYLCGLRCPFLRVSADGVTAFFSIDTTARTILAAQTLDHVQDVFDEYTNTRSWRPYPTTPLLLTRIGTQTNNTTLTEITLPNLQFHRSTAEFSFDWKSLFTVFYREQLAIAKLKQQNGKSYAAIEPIPTYRPLVLPATIIVPGSGLDNSRFEEECEVLRPRFTSYLKDARCSLDDLDSLIKFVYGEVKHTALYIRTNELIRRYDMKWAKCRDQNYFVEDPGSWGWKACYPGYIGSGERWYNDAWEDPADGGRITLFEDPLVVEVESMARAWEKALN